MISRLLTLQSQLEHIAPVYIAAGEPAAPVGSDCDRIYVWVDSVEDNNALDLNSCMVDSRLTIGYAIWTCYQDDADDRTADQYLADATRFTEMIEDVWDTLVSLKDAGTLAGASRCDQIVLNPLAWGSRSGLAVSAVGTIVVQI